MGSDMILGLKIYWPCLKIYLHDPETFFDFPALLIDPYDLSILMSLRLVHTA